MSFRRNPGVSDRHAMLSAYGYNYPTAAQQPNSNTSSSSTTTTLTSSTNPYHRTASPFEQPYASTSSSSSTPYGYGNSANGISNHDTASDQALYDEYEKGKKPTNSGSSASAPSWSLGGWGSSSLSRQAEQLEEANDARLNGLSDRVKILKDITLGIGNEVRQGTADLDSLSQVMSGAADYLGGTMKRMNHMARRQGGWFCNMMIFLVFVCWLFVFLWWWRR